MKPEPQDHSPFKEGVFVTKEDGSIEAFNQEKLYRSLVHSGAEPHQAQKILDQVVEQVNLEKIDTEGNFYTASDIYARAYAVLKRSTKAVAARYSLRRSLLQFGPTGFPFEDYVGELFKAKYGYNVLTGQVVLGGCVPHEVDVVAWNENKLVMAEVKYHSEPTSKTDLKVALYVRARYDDLGATDFQFGNSKVKQKISEGWLITNTRLTDTAIAYGTCKGLHMLSWDYPKEGNMKDMIEETKLHPVTCLSTITDAEKQELLTRGVVLAKNIYERLDVLNEIHISQDRIDTLLEEVGEVLKTIPR